MGAAQSSPKGGGKKKKKKGGGGGKGGRKNNDASSNRPKPAAEPDPGVNNGANEAGAAGVEEEEVVTEVSPTFPERLVIIVGHSSAQVLHKRMQRATPYLRMPRLYNSTTTSSAHDISGIPSQDDEEEEQTTLPVRYVLLGQQLVENDDPEEGITGQDSRKRSADYMHDYLCKQFGISENSELFFRLCQGVSELEQLKLVYEKIRELYPAAIEQVPTTVVSSSQENDLQIVVLPHRERYIYFYKTTSGDNEVHNSEKLLLGDAIRFWNDNFGDQRCVKLSLFVDVYKKKCLREKDNAEMAFVLFAYTLPQEICAAYVTKDEWEHWVMRFGGVVNGFVVARGSVFDKNFALQPYYHHFMGRSEAERLLQRGGDKSYLVRIGDARSRLTVSVITRSSFQHSYIYFDSKRKGLCARAESEYFEQLESVLRFLTAQGKLGEPVPSSLCYELSGLVPAPAAVSTADNLLRADSSPDPSSLSVDYVPHHAKTESLLNYGTLKSIMTPTSTASSVRTGTPATSYTKSIGIPLEASEQDVGIRFLPPSIRHVIEGQQDHVEELLQNEKPNRKDKSELEILTKYIREKQLNDMQSVQESKEKFRHYANAIVACRKAFSKASEEEQKWTAIDRFWLMTYTLGKYLQEPRDDNVDMLQVSDHDSLSHYEITNLVKDISSLGLRFCDQMLRHLEKTYEDGKRLDFRKKRYFKLRDDFMKLSARR
eukprot:gb/GECG01006258.1/.p1 GENE.gb/GECG01006258.1/~~gb/GECG01006258.1/.p1  ORF type:complete len:712 (+),score=100.36 gb/GECG01006258.1/:1-2136(+)